LVFKNKADKKFGGDPVPYKDILFNSLFTPAYSKIYAKFVGPASATLDPFGDFYTKARNNIEEDLLKKIVDSQVEINSWMSSNESLNIKNEKADLTPSGATDVLNALAKLLVVFFQSLVKYVFFLQSMPDIGPALKVVKNFYAPYGTFGVGIKTPTPLTTLTLENMEIVMANYNILRTTQKTFDFDIDKLAKPRDETLKNYLNTWLDEDCKRLDAYKSVEEAFDYKRTNKRRTFFFLSKSGNSDKRENDMKIFIPYLQRLPDDKKRSIVKVVTNSKDLGVKLSEAIESDRASKKKLFEISMRILNTLYETSKLIAIGPNPDDKVSDFQSPPDKYNESNEGILVNEDTLLIEAIKIANDDIGIESNSTDEPKPTSGGNLNSKDINLSLKKLNQDNEPFKPLPAILDLSPTELYWPLMTDVLFADRASQYDALLPSILPDAAGATAVAAVAALADSARKRVTAAAAALLKGGAESSGFHPLLPIYMLLSVFWYSMSPKLASSPDFDFNIGYYNLLLNISKELGKHLDDKPKARQISLGLRTMFFTCDSSSKQLEAIQKTLGMSIDEYREFSIFNSSLVSSLCGKVIQNEEEDNQGVKFLESPVFKNFINTDVKMKDIIIGEPEPEKYDVDVLTKNIFDLLKKNSEIIIGGETSPGTPPPGETQVGERTPTPDMSPASPDDEKAAEEIARNKAAASTRMADLKAISDKRAAKKAAADEEKRRSARAQRASFASDKPEPMIKEQRQARAVTAGGDSKTRKKRRKQTKRKTRRKLKKRKQTKRKRTRKKRKTRRKA
jgi:hypothetical protein